MEAYNYWTVHFRVRENDIKDKDVIWKGIFYFKMSLSKYFLPIFHVILLYFNKIKVDHLTQINGT